MKPEFANLASIIKESRVRKGLTQDQFAGKLKTTQSAVARIERGEQNISAAMLSKISRILGKDVIQINNGSLNVKIEGGHRLKGRVMTKTSKNGAVVLLAAALLNSGKTLLKNVPKIEEVYRMIELLESIGVLIRWIESDVEIINKKKLNIKALDIQSAIKTRSVILLIGPLIHFVRKFKLPQAGGCKLGSRTIKPHVYALERLGVSIETRNKWYEIENMGRRKNNAEIILYESGDTVTENAIMAASLLEGETTIKYASANYQVQDLCFFLKSLGVSISGIGTTTLIINGQRKIEKDIEYYVTEDPIDSMFFLAAAAVTKSEITIARCPINFLELELLRLEKMNFKFKILKRYKARNNEANLADIKTYPSNLVALEEKIESRPYPGLNIDNLPFFAVIATQASGQTFIHDWVYEKRAIYYKELDKLGADTILADPHRIYINGPTALKSGEVICPPALRPAAIVLIGMLAARGISILRNIYSINRGYEDIVARLSRLGAKIHIMKEF